MAKPSVTLRQTKGSALTYAELDQNFTNLRDATVTLTGGSGGTAVTADLNGNITLVAGTNVTISADNTAKTITINATASGSGTVQAGDYRDFAYYDIDPSGQRVNNTPRLRVRADDTGIELNGLLDTRNNVIVNSLGDYVDFTDSIRIANVSTATRDTLAASNGMLIYNTSTNKFQGYANGVWVDLH